MSTYNDFWVEPNRECSRSTDTHLSASPAGAVLVLGANEHYTYAPVWDVLQKIDTEGLDPVRIGIREFLDALHANDDTKHFNKSTLDALEKLETAL